MIEQFLKNMDEDQAANMLESLDPQFIESAVKSGVENHVVPHFSDIRDDALHEYEDSSEARNYYESLPEDEKEEKFHTAAADVLSVLVEIREQPLTGAAEIKGRLRDPWVTEALLLIFDNEDVPDDIVAQQKDFAATWMKWAGMNVIPEAYSQEEVEEMAAEIYPDEDAESVRRDLKGDN